MTVAFKCTHCNSTEGEAFLLGCRDYFTSRPGDFDYWRCKACGLVQLFPIPANIASLYKFYPVHQKKSALACYVRKRVMGRGYYFPPRSSALLRVLDYGCGDGWYLEMMKARGFDVIGYEYDPEYAAEVSQKHRFPVFSCLSELERACCGTLDVVTMHFVVEHLPNVEEIFELAYRLLKPQGIFYFIIPNIHSHEFRLFRRKWHGLDPPRHILFPTESFVRKIADKCRFEVARVRPIGLPNGFAGSVSSVLVGRVSRSLFAGLIIPGLVFCMLFNDDNMAYTLRKIS